MKGLESYIAKHGRHFTSDLVTKVIETRWSIEEIEKYSRNLVYYNVSSATLGDIVYLTNLYFQVFKLFRPTKHRSIKFALDIVENVNTNGYAFNHWLFNGKTIDLDGYI